MRLPFSLAAFLVGSSLLLLGCESGPESPEAPKPDPVVEEPITGVPDAPPLGAPRAKLTPGELTLDDEE